MSRDKQMFNDLVEIFDEEYGRRNLITPQNTAQKLTAKGYCKSSEVAEEIFAEIDQYLEECILCNKNIKIKASLEFDKELYERCEMRIANVDTSY